MKELEWWLSFENGASRRKGILRRYKISTGQEDKFRELL
jgi:hypothetical protein